MFFLKLFFPDECHLYAICLFHILATYAKCLLFQFLSGGVLMHIVILTGVPNGRTNLWKNSQILLKNVFLRLYFQDEGPLFAKFLFDILTIYLKWDLFQFFSRDIHIHIPILRKVQNERECHRKDKVFLLKSVVFKASFPWWRPLVCQWSFLYSNYLS